MKGICEVDSHGRGVLGPAIRETPKATFHERICQVCGRPQGIARIVKAGT